MEKIKYNMPFIGLIVVVFVLIFIISSPTRLFKNTLNVHDSKLKVTTSCYPLYYFASQIGGEKADIKNITPSGAEPHDYDPSTQDVARIQNSSMLILNGGVEAWGDKIRDNLKETHVKIIIAGQGLLTQQVEENGKSQTDPHVWLNPILVKKEVHVITQGFISIDPGNSMYYENNEKALDQKLDQLDMKYMQGLRGFALKDIVTSHAAFGYLASRYGLNQLPIAGLSPDAEPSAQQLADVVTFAKEHNVTYI